MNPEKNNNNKKNNRTKMILKSFFFSFFFGVYIVFYRYLNNIRCMCRNQNCRFVRKQWICTLNTMQNSRKGNSQEGLRELEKESLDEHRHTIWHCKFTVYDYRSVTHAASSTEGLLAFRACSLVQRLGTIFRGFIALNFFPRRTEVSAFVVVVLFLNL